jgi:hypothetical protein
VYFCRREPISEGGPLEGRGVTFCGQTPPIVENEALFLKKGYKYLEKKNITSNNRTERSVWV